MILRRLTDAFRKQDWFTVAVETLIVVFGVFIGLQVNNWNAARNNQELGRFYLERLADDLRVDAAELEKDIAGWQTEIQESDVIIRYLRDGETGERSAWDLLELIYYHAGWLRFAPKISAYDELRSTGQLRLIADPGLRFSISDYYAGLAEYERFYAFDTPLRKVVRGKFPSEPQSYFWDVCFSDDVFRESRDGRLGCPPFEDTDMVDSTLAALRSDPAVIEAFQYTLSVRFIVVAAAKTDLEKSKELLARIEGAL